MDVIRHGLCRNKRGLQEGSPKFRLKGRMPASHRVRNHSIPIRSHNGTALITLILALLAMGVIGAAVFSFTSNSTLNQVGANQYRKAYYLAESGYRYAVSQFIHAGNDADSRENMLETLHDQSLHLSAQDGYIHLAIYPYFFKVTNDPQETKTLMTKIPGGVAPAWSIPSSGRLLIDGSDQTLEFTGRTINHSNVTFTMKKNLSVDQGKAVQLACDVNPSSPSVVTLQVNNYILLKSGTGDAFPKLNGTFRVSTDTTKKVYAYRTRTNDRLDGIYNVDTPADPMNLSISQNSEIVLLKFVELHSTGIVGESGGMRTSREVTYYGPVAAAAYDQTQAPTGTVVFDDMTSMENWTNTPPGHSWGSFGVDATEGAIKVTSTTSAHDGRALIGYKDFFKEYWKKQGNMLSYDAQVKIKAYDTSEQAPLDEFLAGISFRLDMSHGANVSSLGISLLKTGNIDFVSQACAAIASSNASDRGRERGSSAKTEASKEEAQHALPNCHDPVDETKKLYLVLWKDFQGMQQQPIAYKELTEDSGLLTNSTIFFSDDMENGRSNWSADEPWSLVTSSHHSSSHAWTDSPNGDYEKNQDTSLVSRNINLSSASSAVLSFWHKADMKNNHAYGYVKISKNGGRSWTTLEDFTNSFDWKLETFDISSSYFTSDFKIRFEFVSSSSHHTRDGWYIDDVTLKTTSRMVDWPTLLVRVEEKVLDDNVGINCHDPVDSRVNDIKVYISDPQAHGNADSDPLNYHRLANPTSEANWPPEDVDNTTPTNDFFTLVQWDYVANDRSIQLMGTGNESNAVIRTDEFTTESFADGRPEVGLHAYGSDLANNVYFDDFAIRLPGSAGGDGKVGFLPPIQE